VQAKSRVLELECIGIRERHKLLSVPLKPAMTKPSSIAETSSLAKSKVFLCRLRVECDSLHNHQRLEPVPNPSAAAEAAVTVVR